MARFTHIERKAEVLAGKPIIRGTRIGVDLILEKVAAGETADDLLSDHPSLTREAIAEALAYAAEAVREHAKDHPLDEAGSCTPSRER
jgi:uncharacterized protein (DUF433 family)